MEKGGEESHTKLNGSRNLHEKKRRSITNKDHRLPLGRTSNTSFLQKKEIISPSPLSPFFSGSFPPSSRTVHLPFAFAQLHKSRTDTKSKKQNKNDAGFVDFWGLKSHRIPLITLKIPSLLGRSFSFLLLFFVLGSSHFGCLFLFYHPPLVVVESLSPQGHFLVVGGLRWRKESELQQWCPSSLVWHLSNRETWETGNIPHLL